MAENKFPTEVIDLPSEGRLYPPDSPLSSGKIEIKYMTAKEEDILTSQNLIKKGIVIQKLLDSLIMTPNVNIKDLLIGDKNALMVAARILAYGPEYTCEVTTPDTNEKTTQTFNLADCPFKKLPDGITTNEFELDLPVCKFKIKFKLLTGHEEEQIEAEIKASQKFGKSSEVTSRLRYSITEVDGSSDKSVINTFVENMLSRDSLHLRHKIQEISPDIELKQTVEIGGEEVTVDIPLTVDFFWPKTV